MRLDNDCLISLLFNRINQKSRQENDCVGVHETVYSTSGFLLGLLDSTQSAEEPDSAGCGERWKNARVDGHPLFSGSDLCGWEPLLRD